MRIPDLEAIILDHETTFLLCRNCGRKMEYHIKMYDFPSWSWKLTCVVRYPGKPYDYESA